MASFKDAAPSGHLQIITWDAVVKHGLDWSQYDDWLQGKSVCAEFLEKIGRIGMAHDKNSDTEWLVCDPMAVAAAINHGVVKKSTVRLRHNPQAPK